MSFIRVILPLALPWEPVYSTEQKGLQVGDRIRVSLSGRSYVAVVSATDVEPDIAPAKVRPAGEPQPGLEAVTPEEIRFWRALSDYYLCTVGEVYKVAYPGHKTDSEQAAARVRERMEQRLERIRANLEKKHRDNVRQRLEAQAAALERALHPADAKPLPVPEIPLSEAEAAAAQAAAKASGTVLIRSESPRTQLFLHMAADALRRGRSVLWLVPEIALTAALEEAIAEYFPALLTFHSGQSPTHRRDVAEMLRRVKGPHLVLATRSALLLPFRDLGLILLDQEHDPSYKQDAPAPRYGTREAAILLAGIHGARVVLGSATPSLESCFNALGGRYTEIRLNETPRPRRIELIDIPAEKRKKGIYGLLSRRLADSIRTAEKVLLICPTHSSYCTPELVEAELQALYGSVPGHIRIGNQPALLAEGLDFTAFDCVALLQGDALLLGQGDFRADERAWQLLTQLLLRCRPGVQLSIQTSRSGHPLWQYFLQGDADGFYNAQLAERQVAGYPPYSRALDILLRDMNLPRLELLSSELAKALHPSFPTLNIEGPYQPQRPGSETLRQIRILLPRTAALRSQKSGIAALVSGYENDRHYAGHISLDVDPL